MGILSVIIELLNKILVRIKSLRITERFEELDKRKKILVIALFFALGFSFYYKVFFVPSNRSLGKVRSSITSLNSKIYEVRLKIPDITSEQNDLNAAKAEFEDMQQKLQSIEENLPGSESISRILGRLVQEGSGLAVDFVSIKPKAVKDSEQYSRLDIEIKADAAYNNFLNYLHRLENISKFLSPLLVNIEEAKDASRGTIRGTVVLSTLLVMSKASDVKMKAEATIEDLKLGKSPFISTLQPKGEKEKFRLSGINWMGGDKVAIINDNVYREGDVIENMKIKKILPNMIIFFDNINSEDYALTLDTERSKDGK